MNDYLRAKRQSDRRPQKYIVGYRPVVHARQGLMLGIRQPLDGPVFEKVEHAEYWCWEVMVDHYDRRLGLSDARIEPFKGMVDCGKPPNPALLRDIKRICETVKKSERP